MSEVESQIRVALSALRGGQPMRSNGKFTIQNVALEANIARATLYRHLKSDESLRKFLTAELLGSVSVSNEDSELTADPCDPQYRANGCNTVVRELKVRLTSLTKDIADLESRHAHQIYILWSENERLKKKLARLGEKNAALPLRVLK